MTEPRADQKTPEPELDVGKFDAIKFINEMDKARRAVIDECRQNGLLPSDIDSLVRHADLLDEWKRMDCDLVWRSKADFMRSHWRQIHNPQDMWPIQRPLKRWLLSPKFDVVQFTSYIKSYRGEVWGRDHMRIPERGGCGRVSKAPVIKSPLHPDAHPDAIRQFLDYWQGRDVYLATIDRDAFSVLYSSFLYQWRLFPMIRVPQFE